MNHSRVKLPAFQRRSIKYFYESLAIRQSFPEAVLLVDASNAFSCLNQQVALHNIQTLCPPLANILINTYRKDVPLFIDGRHMFSSEGTTQGDPLAMAMYSVSVTPLIASLQDSHVKQVWFAPWFA